MKHLQFLVCLFICMVLFGCAVTSEKLHDGQCYITHEALPDAEFDARLVEQLNTGVTTGAIIMDGEKTYTAWLNRNEFVNAITRPVEPKVDLSNVVNRPGFTGGCLV